MPKKNKYNPSGKPVLTKKVQKGHFLKNLDRNVNRLHFKRKKG